MSDSKSRSRIEGRLLLTAAWVAPFDAPRAAPLLRDGAVLISPDGRVVEVGDPRGLRARHGTDRVVELGRAVLLPGLVNAHAHLELSHLPRLPGDRGLVPWIIDLLAASRDDGEQRVAHAVAEGVRQSAAAGVTCVGDISRLCDATRPLLCDGPLRIVSFGEVLAMGQRRGLLEERLARAGDARWAGAALRIGISPHAPYSVEPEGYRRCVEEARRRGLPLATHLAETPDEAAFLADHAGPLRQLWDAIGGFDDQVPRFARGPVRLAQRVGLLDGRATVLAHVNHVDDDELALLAAGDASVVYCPRTHAHFGHPPHRWRQMLARGINVALGTDSVASSGTLDLVEDLRLLRRLAPEVPAQTLWRMATLHGARALGLDAEIGSIAPGKRADLAAFPLAAETNDPLAALLDAPAGPPRVWIDGRPVTASAA